MDLYPSLSYIKLRNAQHIESVEIVLGHCRHGIPKRESGIFLLHFKDALELPKEKLTLSVVTGMKSQLGSSPKLVAELISFKSIEILSKFWGKRVRKKSGEVSITRKVLSATFGVVLRTKQVWSIEQIAPVMWPAPSKGPSRVAPCFRTLVVGKPGVGKSNLLSRIFGVKTANVTMDRPREVDIEQEFTSPHDGRLVFHISQDFELGDGGNYGIVKSFIERRKTMPIKDQLHAVWLCFRIPVTTLGERLLGDAEKTLLSVRREVLGDTPTIIVFTQYDRLMTCMPKNIPDDPEAERRYLQEHCIQPIQAITGDMDIAHVAVSTKPSYERRLQDLISVTRERVSKTLTLRENQVLPVPLTWAQSSTSKVGLSVDVGRQRYWMLLRASANFPRYTMQDCLRVIHTDIVSVWNFYDPFDYLNSEDFRKMMMNIVNSVDSQPPSDINRSVSFVVLIPMTLIFATGKWAYRTYGRLKAVPRKFMAYIVNLTHVMAILFSLTARMKAKMLTRTAIELVWKAYEESEWMKRTHKDICFFGGRGTACGAVLKEVESMILSGDREIEVSRALKWVSPVDLATDGKC